MMKTVFAFLLLFSSLSWASKSAEEALKKIEEVQKAMKALSLVGKPQCDLNNFSAKCEFKNYCSLIEPNKTNAYIYDDGAGRKVANYNLLTLQEMLSVCRQINGKPVDASLPLEADPFANPFLLVLKGTEKYLPLFKKEEARALNLGESTKAELVSLLEKKKTSKNAKLIDNMVLRVKKVRWEIFLPKSEGEIFEKGCALPNAEFSPSKNGIFLCPQLLGMPEGVLKMTLAHELGHAIDPCHSSLAMIKTGEEESLVSEEYAGPNKVLASIPTSKNPFGSLIQCLQSPQSVQVKPLKNAQKAEIIRNYMEREKLESSDEDYDLLKGRIRNFEDASNEENYCQEGPHDAEAHYLQESFADWISTQILSESLRKEKDPVRAKALAFESQLLGLQSECPRFTADQKASVLKQVEAAGCPAEPFKNHFELGSGEDGSDHLSWDKRSSKIFLADPEMQKALKCQPQKGVVNCK